MFTHPPSPTVFIDADPYINDEPLGFWLAPTLGNQQSQDAEKAASHSATVSNKPQIPAHSEATPNRNQFSASPQEFRAELKLARHAAVHCTYSSRKQAAEVGVEGICVEALERKGIVEIGRASCRERV